jgi:hypothetical protein
MLTCRSCTNFFVQGDFSSDRSRAALRLLVLLLKLSHAESTLTQPTRSDCANAQNPILRLVNDLERAGGLAVSLRTKF